MYEIRDDTQIPLPENMSLLRQWPVNDGPLLASDFHFPGAKKNYLGSFDFNVEMLRKYADPTFLTLLQSAMKKFYDRSYYSKSKNENDWIENLMRR